MPKKKSKDQFSHYKKWTTDEGYIFLAENKKDAKLYLKKTGLHLGSLKEVIADYKLELKEREKSNVN